MGRHRTSRNKAFAGLPLYPAEVDGRTYYRFKDPRTKKYKSLGSDRAAAIKAAGILMASRQEDEVARLVAKVETPGKPVKDAVADFKLLLRKRVNRRGEPLSKKTLADYDNMLERFELQFAGQDMRNIQHPSIADWLHGIPARQSNMIRGLISQLWDVAVARGWAAENVVEKTLKDDEVKIRQRLYIEDFKAIKKNAAPWLAAAMDVALYSVLRREDVVTLPVDKWDGKAGVLTVKLGKTGKELAITAGPNMRKAIEHAISLKPTNAPTIVRQDRSDSKSRHKDTTHVDPDAFTEAFSEARDKIKHIAELPIRARPTVHEIRSLGAALFLWECRDVELVRKLLGHETVKQTLEYLRGHKLPPEAVKAS
jgi:integrase